MGEICITHPNQFTEGFNACTHIDMLLTAACLNVTLLAESNVKRFQFSEGRKPQFYLRVTSFEKIEDIVVSTSLNMVLMVILLNTAFSFVFHDVELSNINVT